MSQDKSQSKPIKFSDEEFSSLMHKHGSNATALRAIIHANTSRKRSDGVYYVSLSRLTDFQGDLDQGDILSELLKDVEIHHDFVEAQKNAVVKSPLTRYFDSNVDISILAAPPDVENEEVACASSAENEKHSDSEILEHEDNAECIEESSQSSTDHTEENEESEPEIVEEFPESTDNCAEVNERSEAEELEAAEAEGIEGADALEPNSSSTQWKNAYSRAIGRSHIKNDTPCQDAVIAITEPRPAIFVADGAGSASNSHFGSQGVVTQLHSAMESERIEAIQKELLDNESFVESENTASYAQGFINTAITSLRKLSEEEEFSISSLKCTLLVVVAGSHRLFWLKVGDGFIVVENNESLELIGPIGKGEFANETSFISDKLNVKDIHYGFIPSKGITGISAFTDGVAEKLVSTNGEKIAGAISKFFHEIRESKLDNDGLSNFLEDDEVWASPYGHDDRGLAILSKQK